MSSTDIVIKSEKQEKRPHKEHLVYEPTLTQSGVLVIPAHSTGNSTSSRHARLTSTESANVMVIPSLDIKGTRLQILGNWRGYTPAKIVGIFRKH